MLRRSYDAMVTKTTQPVPSAPPRGALALLTLPFAFTQDDLLTADKFIQEAKKRGYKLSLDILQELHIHRLLLPLYRVSDTPVEGRRIAVERSYGMNPRGWVLDAAADGRLRDPAQEGYSAAWPYRRPADEEGDRWWNGFIYSSWQLLDVKTAMSRYAFIKAGLVHFSTRAPRDDRRQLTLALSVLATRYLPGILGTVSIPGGVDESGLRKHRSESQPIDLLQLVGFDYTRLSKSADSLLAVAHGEPLLKWLPLLRHASYKGWSRIQGEPLDAMWRRVAAEVLLRAHEDLSVSGIIDPLPDLTGQMWWTPQHDRLTPRHKEAQTLERALAELGLSPHPKVILLVEGETELYHVPKLLAEFGLTQPQQVRVQRTKGSKINAHLIARYGVTPRIGRKLQDRWMLDASLTALVIAMDAENDFATQDKRDKVKRQLQDAIREEVKYQDAEISQRELDALVHVHVWGDDKYELANFSDDELVPAITKIATSQKNDRVNSADWEKDLRRELQEARDKHFDIKVPLGRLRVNEEKVELARLLWPVLLAKCEAEYVSDQVETPVLKLALEVRRLVAEVSGIFALAGSD
ncbi:hypothetical protein [Streptomyces scabiei]|uniref:hypothetical protein n=1 Tax=Streptomyces scabiei TaxID=1930 RepID=UPI001B3316C5|nr:MULTISPECIES: hypothetical protein [Streptomyces]MBP5895220.1 hypothetical protein [Streptomyces sp. LBUM 1481]